MKLKFRVGDRVKEKTTKLDDHDDYQILAVFIGDECSGYIYVNLYSMGVFAEDFYEFDKRTKLSEHRDDVDTLRDFLKDRFENMKKQVKSQGFSNLTFFEKNEI